MRINKKYGFIFLILGLVLLAIAGVYLSISKSTNDGNNNDNNHNNDNVSTNIAYIKSKDTNKKTKISFPIFEKMTDSNYNKDEYNVVYKNSGDNIYIEALTVESKLTLEEYDNNYLQTYYTGLETVGLTYDTQVEKCDYYCKRYKIYKDNKIVDDKFKIYIKMSDTDIGELTLYSNNRDLPEELINGFKKDIKISYDATYKMGKINNNKLVFDFNIEEDKYVVLKIDNGKYEEVENSVNTLYITTIKDKNNNSLINVTLRKKQMGKTINEDLNYYFKTETKAEEIKQNNKTFYKYSLDNKTYYVYLIDENMALLLETNKIELNDFTDIELTSR